LPRADAHISERSARIRDVVPRFARQRRDLSVTFERHDDHRRTISYARSATLDTPLDIEPDVVEST
jgi:hypothetical protein